MSLAIIWFVTLVATICLEGLGRKYLPQVPSGVFYFAKDVVLLFGYYRFRPSATIRRTSSYLYRGFKVVWMVGLLWTVIELLNPLHQSQTLGLLGLRAYWLWWIAPPVIASVLQSEREKRRAIYALLVLAAGIAVLAALQFAAPPDSALNLYSVVEGEEVYADVAKVSSTGRARVSSTFSFVSGFSAFTVLVPTLLLSIGLDARDRRLRRYTFIATCITAAVVPMSGSRASVLIGSLILIVTAWTAGLFATRIGRRTIVGGAAAAVLAVVVFPDAFLGVQSRFENLEETSSRYGVVLVNLVPPLAIATYDYPPFGIGTGMMQNARISMRIDSGWEAEIEAERYLVELGPFGFIVIWVTKLGLFVALLRAYGILKRAGRRGASSAAISYALVTLTGTLTFDHVWQALYFMGCGFILAEVVSVLRADVRAPGLAPPAPLRSTPPQENVPASGAA
jgi:hypothetical protein